MEDGDVIDAHLQQARAHLISYCPRSSRLFSSEVAHAFTHDLFMPDRRVIISICLSTLCSIGSSCVVPTIFLKTLWCLIWSLNQRFGRKPNSTVSVLRPQQRILT
jgi:hypothetical protein